MTIHTLSPRGRVVQIRPKTEKVTHRQQTIILTFIPAEDRWSYRVEYQVRNKLVFEGTGKRRQDALRLAKREIDKMTDGE